MIISLRTQEYKHQIFYTFKERLYTQTDSGGKVSISGGDRIGHYEEKIRVISIILNY
jgi:hypothetical protein